MSYGTSLPKISVKAEKKVIFLCVDLYVLFTWASPQVKISFKYCVWEEAINY